MIQRDGDSIVIYASVTVASQLERFMGKIQMGVGGCWEWLGAISTNGYGVFSFMGRNVPAHRAAYLLFKGPIPEDFQIDHLCKNRKCANPEHLEAVTLVENVMRGNSPLAQYARAKECKRGHLFDEQNTMLDSRGRRNCRTCKRDRNRERWYTHNRPAAKAQRRARQKIVPGIGGPGS